MKANIVRKISVILFFIYIVGNYVNAFANDYSKELNVLMKKESPSFTELAEFIDEPPVWLYKDHQNQERAIATGMLYKVNETNVARKLENLATDLSPEVRVATIVPLLAHNKEKLACLVFKKEIIESNKFRLYGSAPFYAPNSGTNYKLYILKKNPKFLEELLNAIQINSLDEMLRLRIAVTVYFLNKKEIARRTAQEIIQGKDNSVPVVSWAEWILRDFKKILTAK